MGDWFYAQYNSGCDDKEVTDILEKLSGQAFRFQDMSLDEACDDCHTVMSLFNNNQGEGPLFAAKRIVRENFTGLCLDCMRRSNEDGYEDWYFQQWGKGWDLGCRVNHNAESWFYSFRGWDGDRDKTSRRIKEAISSDSTGSESGSSDLGRSDF